MRAELHFIGALLIAVFLLATFSDARAQESKRADDVFYAELVPIIIWGNMSINYERVVADRFSIRAGVGSGYHLIAPLFSETKGGGCFSALFMLNYMTQGAHKIEISGGVSYTLENKKEKNGGTDSYFLPAISIGYRYQPVYEGFMFRVGFVFANLYQFGPQVSLGYAF